MNSIAMFLSITFLSFVPARRHTIKTKHCKECASRRPTRIMQTLRARLAVVLWVLSVCTILYIYIPFVHHKNLFRRLNRVAPTQRTHPRNKRGEIPHIIHQTWMTSRLPTRYAPWVTSWLKKNPTWQYWLWTDDDARHLVERYYKQYLAMYNGYPRNINRADVMRYFVLDKYGGVYADIDMECLRPLDDIISNHSCILSEEHKVHSYMLAGRKPPPNVLNTPMACRPGHRYFRDVIAELPKWQNHSSLLEQTGPLLIDRVLRTYLRNHTRSSKDSIAVMSAEVFNPTFVQSYVRGIKARCTKRGPTAIVEDVYVQEVCAELKATHFSNAPTNLSYTTHYWIHTYMSSYPEIRHFVNITTILQTLGESFNVTAPSSTVRPGDIPRYKFGPFR